VLEAIRLRDYAIFGELEVEFAGGLNLLTGETGAGKSLLVGAISLLLGGRADKDMVRLDAGSAHVEAVFSVTDGVRSRLRELQIEVEGDELIFAREISAAGRSRFFMNARQIPASAARDAVKMLVQIYGQNEHQTLTDPQNHAHILDEFAGARDLFRDYRAEYQRALDMGRKLSALEERLAEAESRADYLRFVVAEIERAAPEIGEDERLDADRERIRFAAKLKELAQQADALVYSGSASAAETLGRAREFVSEASRIDRAGFAPVLKELDSALAMLEDVGPRLAEVAASLDFDPGELDRVEERRDLLNRLKRKYGGSIESVLGTLEQFKRELAEVENRDSSKAELEEELKRVRAGAERLADKLSSARRKGAEALERWMKRELAELALEGAGFAVELVAEEDIGPYGRERVQFLFAPNPGEGARPLDRIASGGELSRLLLALKGAAARADEGLVLVFDEVDAGIGGRAAERVGRRLKSLSGAHQVLCVTHQAQIAKFADRHLVVSKETRDGRTFGLVHEVAGVERMREIARMLAGERITDKALQHARELVESARGGS